MNAIQRVARVIGAMAMVLAMVAGLQVSSPVVAQESTGTLSIALVDTQGNPLGGGCFDVTDAGGATQSACDDDGDGVVEITNLAPGDAAVTQTSGPDGYTLADAQVATVIAGAEVHVELVRAVIAESTVEPTEVVEAPTAEPTAEETATSTIVPTVTETASTPEPEGTPAPTEEAEASPPPSPTLSSEERISTAAELRASFTRVKLSTSSGTNSDGSYLEFLPGSGYNLGHWFIASAEVVGSSPEPTGGVTFSVYKSTDCTGNALLTDVLLLDSQGRTGSTQPLLITEPGIYNVIARYSGDTVYAAQQTSCGDFSFYNSPDARPGHAATITDPEGTAVTSLAVGDPFRVLSVISGLNTNPSGSYGSVTYYIYRGDSCAGAPWSRSTDPLAAPDASGTTTSSSATVVADEDGTLSARAYYSGTDDLVNSPRWSPCSGPVTVDPALSLTVQATASTGEAVVGSVTLGGSSSATGTVSYSVFAGDRCSGTPFATRGPYPFEGDPPPSESVVFATPGTYSWIASVTVEGDGGVVLESNCAQLIVAAPQLQLTLSSTRSTYEPGVPVDYMISMRNLGEGRAIRPAFSIQLPAGINWTILGNSTALTCGPIGADRWFYCAASFLNPGVENLAQLRGTAAPTQCCGPISATATASADNHAAISSDTLTVTLRCDHVDVAIAKSPIQAKVAAGGEIGFLLTAQNISTQDATQVVVSDTLPVAYTWSENSAGCDIGSGVLTCNFGTIAGGESKSVTVTATTSSDECGTIENTASVRAGNETAGFDGNNSATASLKLTCPDLEVTKQPIAPSVSAGAIIEFRIRVANIGDGDALAVKLIDGLPYGIEWSTESPGCVVLGGALGCELGTVAGDTSRLIIVRGVTTAASCGPQGSYVFTWAENERTALILNNITYGEFIVRCS